MRRLVWTPLLIGLLTGATALLTGQAWIAVLMAATASSITAALLAQAMLRPLHELPGVVRQTEQRFQAGLAQSQRDRAQMVAIFERLDALNKRYHLGTYSSAALAGPKPAAMTTRQWQGELARGDALNKLYGLGAYAESSKSSASAAPVSPPVVALAAGGFDWGAAGIGAGAAIGLALLATGMVVVVRQTRRPQLSTPS